MRWLANWIESTKRTLYCVFTKREYSDCRLSKERNEILNRMKHALLSPPIQPWEWHDWIFMAKDNLTNLQFECLHKYKFESLLVASEKRDLWFKFVKWDLSRQVFLFRGKVLTGLLESDSLSSWPQSHFLNKRKRNERNASRIYWSDKTNLLPSTAKGFFWSGLVLVVIAKC